MALDSVDKLVAGFQKPRTFGKSFTPSTLGQLRVHSIFQGIGMPGPGVASSAGVAGEALSAPLLGCIPRSNPTSGLQARLARLTAFTSQAGMLWLVDRLWQNSGLSVTSTSTQTVSSVTLPARDDNGATDGFGVMCGVEVTSAVGTGTPTLTLSYTSSAGFGGRTVSIAVAGASAGVGAMEIFPWASGDRGIRSIQSLGQSATRTTGAFSLVLFRVIAMMDCQAANVNFLDPITGALPRIYDDSCLQFLWSPNSASATSMIGNLSEVWG